MLLLGFFLIDTLGTLVIRTLLKKKWKNRHRSHPYQNYARKYGHNKMSLIVIVYHVIWLLPIMLSAIYFTDFQIFLRLWIARNFWWDNIVFWFLWICICYVQYYCGEHKFYNISSNIVSSDFWIFFFKRKN